MKAIVATFRDFPWEKLFQQRWRTIFSALILSIFAWYAIDNSGYKISTLILIFFGFFSPYQELWNTYKQYGLNQKNNERLQGQAAIAFRFINTSEPVRLTIPIEICLRWEESFEEYLKKTLGESDVENINALVFGGLLMTYRDYVKRDLLSEVNEKLDLCRSLQKIYEGYVKSQITMRERIFSGVVSRLGENSFSLEELLRPLSAVRSEKIIVSIAQEINAPHAFDFISSQLHRERELKEALREIIKKELDPDVLQEAVRFNSARGLYFVFGKSLPTDVEKKFLGKMPMLATRGVPYAANIPGVGTSAIVTYLVRPFQKYVSTEAFVTEIKRRIERSKETKRKNYSEIIVVGIDSDDIVHSVIGDEKIDTKNEKFRQIVRYLLTGEELNLMENRSNPKNFLWKINLSFEEILKRLPTNILCRSIKPAESRMLNLVDSLVKSELGIINLFEWRNRSVTEISEVLITELKKLCIGTHAPIVRRCWKDDAILEKRGRLLARQIRENSLKYYDALNA